MIDKLFQTTFLFFALNLVIAGVIQASAQSNLQFPEAHFNQRKHNISDRAEDILIDHQGNILIAMRRGVQKFNGKRWSNIYIGKDSLKVNPIFTPDIYKLYRYKKQIFLIGEETIGYLHLNTQGKYLYKEIADVKEVKSELYLIRQVVTRDNHILFLGIKGILVWNTISQKKTIQRNNFKTNYVTYHNINHQLYIRVYKQPTQIVDTTSFSWRTTQRYPFIKETFPRHIFQLKDKRLLVVSQKREMLVRSTEGDFKSLDSELNNICKKEQEFYVQQRKNQLFIKAGKHFIIYDFFRKKILYLRTFRAEISSFTLTPQNNLWVATLNDGVYFIETNANYKKREIQQINERSYKFGDIQIKVDNLLYVNITTSDWQKKYKLPAIYKIKLLNKKIFFLTTNGFYRFNEKRQELIKESNKSTQYLLLSSINPNIYYQFTGNSFLILEEQSKGFKTLDSLSLKAFIRGVVEKNGNLWARAGRFGITRIALYPDGKAVKYTKAYLRIKKPEYASFVPFKFRDKVCFHNTAGIYYYDELKDSVLRYTIHYKDNQQKPTISNPFIQHYTFLHPINNDSILVTPGVSEKYNTPGILIYKNNGFNWHNTSFRRMPRYRYEHLRKLNKDTFQLFTNHNIYEIYPSKKVNIDYAFKTYLRSVQVKVKQTDSTSGKEALVDSSIYYGNLANPPSVTLLYPHNTLTFTYASDSWAAYERNLYSYQLIGLDDNWSDWSTEQKKEYTHLREGTYTFKVRCKNIYSTISSVDSYTFTILPPWHRTAWAYALYVLAGLALLIGGSYGYSRYRSRKLYLRNQHLELVVAERTEEIKVQKETIEIANEELTKANQRLREERDEKVKIYMQEATEAANKLQKVRNTLNEKGIEAVKRMIGNEIEGVDEFAIVREKVHQEFPAFAETIDQAFIDKKVTKLVWQVGHCLKLGMSPMETGETLSISNRSVSVHGTKLRKLGILEPIKKA
ncbi:triple tyrosine motif-containing protein [Microscilla marina]|uniref:Two component regulator three Y motif family n=1 Tax=Microscilla marina ATCC 23134 TaxID=313606 RepID=A1ZIL3_MICM2|nr:triple tyrosine motif-containing protein [Microscilla marina]EAY29881.1 Two component regulator three Y motif family [Microscilla marina ATCC 23134]